MFRQSAIYYGSRYLVVGYTVGRSRDYSKNAYLISGLQVDSGGGAVRLTQLPYRPI
jgi:hypothetical protein